MESLDTKSAKDVKDIESEEYAEVLSVYNSDLNPIDIMIEPKGTVKYIEKIEDITAESLRSILS